jgi:4-diphosphocytidyl-2-C-methyl-D-erythritol kinase
MQANSKAIYTNKSYAKVNIFLKIAGKRDNYHLLVSRFARVKSLYDTISFSNGLFNNFTLEGNFTCDIKQNTIYKAYLALNDISSKVGIYFKTHKVTVIKNIPEFAGLGGGSSNCATFMIMVNEVCELKLSKDELAHIASKIGADVPFFIYEYDSANVTGIGEVVQKFDEDILDIQTFTPSIQCNTGEIFKEFREKYYTTINKQDAKKLLTTKSKDIIKHLNIKEANDLYAPASSIYEQLQVHNLKFKETYHFSGSGSSFFKIL